MEQFVNNFRYVLRRLWFWWETWVILICCIIVLSAIISGSVKDQIVNHNKAELEIIHEQNQRSMEDRAFLHQQDQKSIDERAYLRSELEHQKAALKRLERALKTGEYP